MKTEEPYFIREAKGTETPLILSIPHTGTEVPPPISRRFSCSEVAALPDTDWHLHRLYAFASELGAKTIFARFSRYVVDLNRPRDGHALYPGRDETGVVPTSTFESLPIYRPGEEPSRDETEERLEQYYRPYHERLAQEIAARRERFGVALLFDAHSIVSEVPRLFSGTLPGLMLGDVEGTSADPEIARAVLSVHENSGVSFRKNDPFKGGTITRLYGRPGEGVHALQLEMSQRLYMDEGPPFAYREDRAERLVPVLRASLEAFLKAGSRL